MQDVAGLRLVVGLDLLDRKQCVDALRGLFPDSRIVRRLGPSSHGYRAVHVIARLDDLSVEIQVRTTLQDLWAQAMEKLADRFGRDVRYGAIPENGATQIRELLAISKDIAFVELFRARLQRGEYDWTGAELEERKDVTLLLVAKIRDKTRDVLT